MIAKGENKEFNEIHNYHNTSVKVGVGDLKLTSTQQEIWSYIEDSNYKYVVCNISRQSGKSLIALLALVKWLLKKNTSICYVTPYANLAREFFSDLIKVCGNFKKNLFTVENRSDLKIETTLNSKIQFFSSQNASSIRGNTFTHIVLDECAYLLETTTKGDALYESVLLPAFSVKGRKMLVISTPFGKQGLFYKLCMMAQNPTNYNKKASPNRWRYIKKTIHDNPLIPTSEIESYRSQMTDEKFKQEYLCEFIDSGLTCLKGFEERFKTTYEFNFNLPLWVGIDLSFTDNENSDNTVVTFVNTLNQVIQFKINGSLDKKYLDITNLINKNSRNIVNITIETNSGGIVILNELKKYIKDVNIIRKLTEFQTRNDNKNSIINYLQLLIEKGEIEFNSTDEELYFEMSVFISNITKNKNVTFSAKSGFHDDRIMSLALALNSKYENPHIKRSLSYSG